MPVSAPRTIDVTTDDFTFEQNPTAGSETIVGTAKVPKGHVWHVPVGEPLEVVLVNRQQVTVSASAAGETVTLDPKAPKVDFLDDVTLGEYTDSANIALWDETDPANPIQVNETDGPVTVDNGTYTEAGDFITGFDVSNADASEKTLAVYTVASKGLIKLQKRSAGKSNVKQELQSETATTFAFSNPSAPDTDRQLTWNAMENKRRTIPEKFLLDIVYYDQSYTLSLTDTEDVDGDGTDEAINPSNLSLQIPMIQRGLRPNEDPEQLRREVRADMASRD